ncbi:hypothetical protein AYO20_01899 [Fonsecaea nubica]|uniref:Metallo-beta-lactamase domain-containing protein n=1 Tax=Fonsecaea nubica TaxID=856822 RepID=A0A178DBT3_9EURO|nr:hypothetical protein AYO20_01899 [Fonsecaea nubica]OAL38693.1 hypothetical protein AYO20_01899 [Fonsecaea nubica]
MEPKVRALYEPVTGTWQYIVADEQAKDTVIINPVLDYDKDTGKVSTQPADQMLDVVAKHEYTVSKILETHGHADHLTAGVPPADLVDAFDHTFADDESFAIPRV